MKNLPIPKNGKINHICHISDIHIRPGTDVRDEKLTRFDEYNDVFNRICSFLQANYQHHDDLVICITGDIVHDNKKAGASCISLFYILIGNLAKIAPVYIIRGNHDYNQASIKAQDMLYSLLSKFPLENVAYLNETGVYTAGNVCFGLVAIQDVLRAGDTSGRVAELPSFPSAMEMPDNMLKIALFHGDVPKRFPLNWFGKGYDYMLFGDLHSMQLYNGVAQSEKLLMQPVDGLFKVNSYTKDIPGEPMWGYPGSMIQQDFGESLAGHGLIMWNLIDKTATAFHVPNTYGFITSRKVQESWQVNLSHPAGNGKTADLWIDVDDFIASHQPWFPKHIRLRIKSSKNSIASLFDITQILQSHGFVIESTCTTSAFVVDEQHSNIDYNDIGDVRVFNEPTAWCDYIRETVHPDNLAFNDWTSWMLNPTSLIMQTHTFPNDVSLTVTLDNDIKDRNKKIQSALDDYSKAKDLANASMLSHTRFSLCYMNWAYILCFKNDCYFDFKKLEGQIHCIGGRNGYGKTSWLETICIALFGEGFPSRINKNYTASIICLGKPIGSRAFTSIVFEIDHNKYKVTRVFETQCENKLHSKDITLEQYNDSTMAFQLLHTGKLATTDWIKKNVGSVQSFLTSCIITQNSDEDFFSRNHLMQKSYLDQQLRLDSSTAYAELLKTTCLGYEDISKKLANICELKKSDKALCNFDIADLDKARDDLNVVLDKLNNLDCEYDMKKNEWSVVNEKLLSRGKTALVQEIDDVRNNLKSVDIKETVDDLLAQKAVLRREYDAIENVPYMKTYSNKNQVENAISQHYASKPISDVPELSRTVLQKRFNEITSELGGDATLLNVMHLEGKIKACDEQLLSLDKKLLCCSDDLDKLRDKRDKSQADANQLAANQPPVPLITDIEYQDWLDQLEPFEKQYISFESFVKSVENMEVPNVKRPSWTSGELHNAKKRWAKWAQCVVDGTGVTPPMELVSVFDKLMNDHVTVSIPKVEEAKKKLRDLQEDVSRCEANYKRVEEKLRALLENKPETPKYVNAKDRLKEHNKFKKLAAKVHDMQNKLVGVCVEQLLAVCEFYPVLKVKLDNVSEKQREINELINSCDKHNFNPKCKACMSHPWKKKLDGFLKMSNELGTEKDAIQSEMVSRFGKMINDDDFDTFRTAKTVFNELTSVKGEFDRLNAFWEEQTNIEAAWKAWNVEKLACDTESKKALKLFEETKAAASKCKTQLDALVDSLERDKAALDKIKGFCDEWNNEFMELEQDIKNNELAIAVWDEWDRKQKALWIVVEEWKALVDRKDDMLKQKDIRLCHIEWKNNWTNARFSVETLDIQLKTLAQDIENVKTNMQGCERDCQLFKKQRDHCVQLAEYGGMIKLHDGWDHWNQMNKALHDTLKAVCIVEELNGIEVAVAKARKRDTLMKQEAELLEALGVVDAFETCRGIDKLRGVLLVEKTELTSKIKALEKMQVDYQVAQNLIDKLMAVLDQYLRMTNTMRAIMKEFVKFKDWVLEEKIIPVMLGHVNNLLDVMCVNHRPLRLDCVFDGGFQWRLADGDHSPPLEKASGFQRFVVGLAMRIVLGRLGVAGIKNTQLFIDEGLPRVIMKI